MDNNRNDHGERLRPRIMNEDEFPPDGLVEAMDLRRRHEPEVRIIHEEASVVKLGRLRPGKRVDQ